jgi:hypothetical protein
LTTDLEVIPMIDLSSDPNNCGACGIVCTAGSSCVAGECTVVEWCINGHVQACYSGPAGTADIASCRAGTQTCAAGEWGACLGEVLPSLEVCNGQDDDCDGMIDDEDAGALCQTGEMCMGTEGCRIVGPPGADPSGK